MGPEIGSEVVEETQSKSPSHPQCWAALDARVGWLVVIAHLSVAARCGVICCCSARACWENFHFGSAAAMSRATDLLGEYAQLGGGDVSIGGELGPTSSSLARNLQT